MTPFERTLRARLGAYSLHALGRTNTGPARKAFLARFEKLVDPDGVLPEEERQKRALAAKKAYFTRISFKKSRKGRKNNKPAR